VQDIERALEIHLPERHRRLLDSNKAALVHGAGFARSSDVTAIHQV